MKIKTARYYHILVFIAAQIAWLLVLGLWIYRWVASYILINQVVENSPEGLPTESSNLLGLVGGLALLAAVQVGMSMNFRRLNIHFNLNRMYDNFIANVTHELKSPLASIQLHLETLGHREVPPARQKEFIELMSRDVKRLDSLINTILVIPGMEQKKIAYEFHVHGAENLVRGLVREAEEQFQPGKGAIQVRGRAPCRCVVDRNAFLIVLNNLIDNAIKYSPPPLHLTVSMACSSRWFVLKVTDRGIGIAPGDQKKVFEKFHRIDRPDSPSVKGTGLGLYWIREIVQAHGGRITLQSAGHGTGSTFRIELPIYRVSRKRFIRNLIRLTQRQKRQRKTDHE